MNGFAVTRFDLFWHLLFSIPTNKLTHGICTYCVYRYGIEVYAINLISPSYVCRFMNGARLLVASLKQIPPKRSAKASHESNSIFHCDILLNIFEIRFNFLNCLGKINSTYIPGPTLHKFVRGWASHIRCKRKTLQIVLSFPFIHNGENDPMVLLHLRRQYSIGNVQRKCQASSSSAQ